MDRVHPRSFLPGFPPPPAPPPKALITQPQRTFSVSVPRPMLACGPLPDPSIRQHALLLVCRGQPSGSLSCLLDGGRGRASQNKGGD